MGLERLKLDEVMMLYLIKHVNICKSFMDSVCLSSYGYT